MVNGLDGLSVIHQFLVFCRFDYKCRLVQMKKAADNLEFEQAAKIRDEIRKLQERELEINMSSKIKVYNDDVKKELIGRSTQGKAGMIAKKKR